MFCRFVARDLASSSAHYCFILGHSFILNLFNSFFLFLIFAKEGNFRKRGKGINQRVQIVTLLFQFLVVPSEFNLFLSFILFFVGNPNSTILLCLLVILVCIIIMLIIIFLFCRHFVYPSINIYILGAVCQISY